MAYLYIYTTKPTELKAWGTNDKKQTQKYACQGDTPEGGRGPGDICGGEMYTGYVIGVGILHVWDSGTNSFVNHGTLTKIYK